ncbi:MAG: MCE family protein [Planctomycetes bacterium]|nr:MCE family protein [Planctomycetota bacterium]
MQSAKNEILAGTIVLAAVCLLLVGLFKIGAVNLAREKPRALSVRFDDASGLKTYDPVFYAGVEVGKVTRIALVRVEQAVPPAEAEPGKEPAKDPKKAPEMRMVTLVEVQMEVKADVEYKSGSEAMIDKTLTGITSVVIRPGPGADALKEGEYLKARHADTLTDIAANVKPLVQEVKALIADLRKLVGDEEVRANFKGAFEKINKTAEELQSAVGTLKSILQDNKENLGAAIANLKETTASADAILKENREKLKGIFEGVQKFTDGLDATKGKLDEALANLDSAMKKGGEILDSNSRNIAKSIANMKDTSTNLKATSEEVRRHPWWLLHNPDEEEIESLNLYDAARHFNSAAGSLNEAAAELAALTKGGGPPPPDVAKEALAKVEATLAKYQEAEGEFWKRLKAAKGGK